MDIINWLDMMVYIVSLYTYFLQEMDEAGGGPGQTVRNTVCRLWVGANSSQAIWLSCVVPCQL